MKNILNNILASLKGGANRLKGAGGERLIWMAVIAILLGYNTCKVKKVKNQKPTFEDCTDYAIAYADSLIAALPTTEIIAAESTDKPAATEIVAPPRIDTRIVEKAARTFEENEMLKDELLQRQAENDRINRDLQIAISELDRTREEFDKYIELNGSVVVEVPETETTPELVRTDLSKTDERYTINEQVWSYGPLARHERSITVFPQQVPVVETEYITKSQFLALKAGYIRMTEQNEDYYSPSLEYGKNWWVVEGGALLNENLDFRGVEVKAGLVIKLK